MIPALAFLWAGQGPAKPSVDVVSERYAVVRGKYEISIVLKNVTRRPLPVWVTRATIASFFGRNDTFPAMSAERKEIPIFNMPTKRLPQPVTLGAGTSHRFTVRFPNPVRKESVMGEMGFAYSVAGEYIEQSSGQTMEMPNPTPENDQGYRMSKFSMLGSDGRTYDRKALTAGRPVLLVNLVAKRIPKGIADFNRLSRMMGDKVRVVGVVLADAGEMRDLIAKHGIEFLLVSPGASLATEREIRTSRDMEVHLANALLLPDGRITRFWYDYSQTTFKRMEADVREQIGKSLGLDLTSFPKKL
ncbi:hypothetical protein EON81_06585 [bacterium]|nr:MAG: hypothetical protein EON81_06585 [bacterium]